ncbi:hypothetical protein FIBSPDRAFT_1050680 [Athelia psychrophila]|uniref:Uncharacterized protein n=1 Tax=Athelia psychrophila TaxID=1759441 RepID=A0A166AET1_9AGAM|nr:hypothetical protein FIBSPDRAFT_1050680 [Fibularhizoctonia sp. CBS 109695]
MHGPTNIFADDKTGVMTPPDLVKLGDGASMDDCSVVARQFPWPLLPRPFAKLNFEDEHNTIVAHPDLSAFENVLYWFVDPPRIAWHLVSRVIRASSFPSYRSSPRHLPAHHPPRQGRHYRVRTIQVLAKRCVNTVLPHRRIRHAQHALRDVLQEGLGAIQRDWVDENTITEVYVATTTSGRASSLSLVYIRLLHDYERNFELTPTRTVDFGRNSPVGSERAAYIAAITV